MWKIAVGFALFAGLALYILSIGGDIDMGGEKHGGDAMHTDAPAAAASAAAATPAPAAAPAAPAASEAK